MTKKAKPPAPVRELPAEDWEHYQLYKDVREAVSCLPIYFRTETQISGIMATDLHTLNTVLGATIEEQVVNLEFSPHNVVSEREVCTLQFRKTSANLPRRSLAQDFQ